MAPLRIPHRIDIYGRNEDFQASLFVAMEAMSHDHHLKPARHVGQGRNWSGPWRKTPGRVAGTAFVRLYQLTLSGFVGNSCRHLPTCSEYAYEAIARHGLWAGGWMGLFRVMRCGPGGTHGIDRVPERLGERYRWFLPWRYWSIGKKRTGHRHEHG